MPNLRIAGKVIVGLLDPRFHHMAKKAMAPAALIFAGLLGLFSTSARTAGRSGTAAGEGEGSMPFELKSPAFKPGGDIPKKYTCDGMDASPALNWTDPPAGAESFVLIADDPDAPMGTWVHWVLYDLPASARQLSEGVPKTEEIQGGGRNGLNDFPSLGYGGPCPPPGKPHRYFFKLYALDSKLNLKPGATKQEVEQTMKGHILAQAELMGRYRR